MPPSRGARRSATPPRPSRPSRGATSCGSDLEAYGRYQTYFRKSMCDGHPVFGRHTQIWSHLDHRHGGVGVCASPGVRAAPHARVGQRESACASERGCGGGVPGASTSADSSQISSLRAALTTGVFSVFSVSTHRRPSRPLPTDAPHLRARPSHRLIRGTSWTTRARSPPSVAATA